MRGKAAGKSRLLAKLALTPREEIRDAMRNCYGDAHHDELDRLDQALAEIAIWVRMQPVSLGKAGRLSGDSRRKLYAYSYQQLTRNRLTKPRGETLDVVVDLAVTYATLPATGELAA